MVIIDRSLDVAPLIIHEYTYQALAYDILEIPTCTQTSPKDPNESCSIKDTFVYKVKSNSGLLEVKKAFIEERDDLWVRYRHQHIQAVNEDVRQEIQAFIEENAIAKMQKNVNQSAEETLQAVRSLPQYQETLSGYWTHVTISERCFEVLQSHDIMKVGAVEQDLCCGVDKEGKEISISKLESSLYSLLSDTQIRPEIKLRLALLYLTHVDGLDAADQQHVTELAQMSLVHQRCVQRFLSLGLHSSQLSKDRTACRRHSHVLENDKERIKLFKKRAKSAQYELSRFQPAIKAVMEKATQGTLHGGSFPFVDEPSMNTRLSRSSSEQRSSIAERMADWNLCSVADPPANVTQAVNSKTRGVVIIFVIGGVSHSEMRCAYEVSKDTSCDIYLGGTSIITPSQWIKDLKDSAPLT